MKRTCLSLCLLFAMLVGTMAASSKAERQKVYIFGMATSFVDSVAYITEVQELDAYVLSNGFLADRSLYTLQLNNYFVGKRGLEHMTCAVFFKAKKASTEKKRDKIRKKYRSGFHGIPLSELRPDMFRFTPEEWVDPVQAIENSDEPKKEKSKKKEKK